MYIYLAVILSKSFQHANSHSLEDFCSNHSATTTAHNSGDFGGGGGVPCELWLRRRDKRVKRALLRLRRFSATSACSRSAEKSESSVPSELLPAVLWKATTVINKQCAYFRCPDVTHYFLDLHSHVNILII